MYGASGLILVGRLLAVLWFLGMAAPAFCGDLYSARVPVVSGDDSAARDEGLAHALQTVVEQVTGDAGLAASARLKPEYDSAARYASEYRFVETADGRELEARFEPSAVDLMLKRQGVTAWSERPTVLVWMAAPPTGRDQLLPSDLGSHSWETMDAALRAKGFAMLRPLMDLEDQTRLSGVDIVARRSSKVREASVRYNPDAMITVYIDGSGNDWQSDWMLLSGELTRRWSTRAADQAGVIQAGVADAAGILHDQLATSRALDLSISGSAEPEPRRSPLGSVPPPGPLLSPATSAGSTDAPSTQGSGGIPASTPSAPFQATPQAASEAGMAGFPASPATTGGAPMRSLVAPDQVLVRVAGIGGSGDYRRAMSVFQGNAAVSALEVVAVEPDSFILAVTPAAGEQALAESLTAEGVLAAEPSGADTGLPGVSMYYRLNP